MNEKELRRACEVAGLKVYDGDTAFYQVESAPGYQGRHLGLLDPALIPYVAEILVAKVEASTAGQCDHFYTLLCTNPCRHAIEFATAEQRIRAAMAVLEEK